MVSRGENKKGCKLTKRLRKKIVGLFATEKIIRGKIRNPWFRRGVLEKRKRCWPFSTFLPSHLDHCSQNIESEPRFDEYLVKSSEIFTRINMKIGEESRRIRWRSTIGILSAGGGRKWAIGSSAGVHPCVHEARKRIRVVWIETIEPWIHWPLWILVVYWLECHSSRLIATNREKSICFSVFRTTETKVNRDERIIFDNFHIGIRIPCWKRSCVASCPGIYRNSISK